MKKALELKPDELASVCDPSSLGFKTTDEIVSDGDTIGQERALAAIASDHPEKNSKSK